MNISIRQATSEDIETIKEILAHAVNHKLLRGDVSWGFASYEGTDVSESIRDKTAYLAFIDGVVVGTFVLRWSDERAWGPQPPIAAYIQRLAVSNNQHRQNIGAQIIDAIAVAIAQHDLTHVRLTCSSANKKLCDYYTGLGFVRADASAHPAHTTKPTAYFERRV